MHQDWSHITSVRSSINHPISFFTTDTCLWWIGWTRRRGWRKKRRQCREVEVPSGKSLPSAVACHLSKDWRTTEKCLPVPRPPPLNPRLRSWRTNNGGKGRESRRKRHGEQHCLQSKLSSVIYVVFNNELVRVYVVLLTENGSPFFTYLYFWPQMWSTTTVFSTRMILAFDLASQHRWQAPSCTIFGVNRLQLLWDRAWCQDYE